MHRLTRLAALAAAAVSATLAIAPAAGAAEITRKKSMWGPAFVNGVSQFPIYADLGVGIYQTTVRWDQIAPSRPADPRNPADPAYRWPAEFDATIAEARRHGIAVSMAIVGTPHWASGSSEWNRLPTRLADFADFTAALSRRYPAVRHFLIWIEPTKSQNHKPLYRDRGRPLRGRRARPARRYARMLDQSYAALKSVSKRNLVIGGNTFTTGTVTPRNWIRALKLPNGRPPRMDLYGHNPFTLRTPGLARGPLGNGYADFSDLDTLMRWLDRHLRRSRPDGRRLPVFISEFSLPTDHANHEFNFFVNRATQADWIRRCLRIVRGHRRLYTFGYLGLYDDPIREDQLQVERGLIERDGERKPAYEAFRRS